MLKLVGQFGARVSLAPVLQMLSFPDASCIWLRHICVVKTLVLLNNECNSMPKMGNVPTLGDAPQIGQKKSNQNSVAVFSRYDDHECCVMHTVPKKPSSHKINSQIIASLMVDGLLLIRPQDYGARHIGAAMERVLIALTVRKCEGSGAPCTTAKVAALLKMPRSSVQRIMSDLVFYGIVKAMGRAYVTQDDPLRGTVARRRTIARAIVKAGRTLERLEEGLVEEGAKAA